MAVSRFADDAHAVVVVLLHALAFDEELRLAAVVDPDAVAVVVPVAAPHAVGAAELAVDADAKRNARLTAAIAAFRRLADQRLTAAVAVVVLFPALVAPF